MQCRSGEFLCWMRARQRWGLWKISRRIFGVISIRAGNVCIRWWNIIDSSNGFFMYFFLGVLVCFFLFCVKGKKKQSSKMKRKSFIRICCICLWLFFLCLCYILYDCQALCLIPIYNSLVNIIEEWFFSFFLLEVLVYFGSLFV